MVRVDETMIEGVSSKLEEAREASSVVVKKRKAEWNVDTEDENSGDERERSSYEEAKIDEPKDGKEILKAPDWDVDSFEGLEYYSSSDPDLSSDEKPYPDMEMANKHYRIYKRQIIDSKGFYAEPEFSLGYNYKRIFPLSLERGALDGKNMREYWGEMANVCLRKHNEDKRLNVEFIEVVRGNYRGGPRSKSYITFMAREKPDGPLVEYQAKCMVTLDRKMHPILCRLAPTPKPEYQN